MANDPQSPLRRSPSHLSEGGIDLSAFSLFSTTLLSTIRLNKLLHLILTAITNSKVNLFARAMLFLNNEKTGTLQGMLGVTRAEAEGLTIVASDPDNPLTGYWELDETAMERQRQSDFSSAVRQIRIDLNDGCQIVGQVVRERKLCFTDDATCLKCNDCGFIKRFGIRAFAAAPLATREKLIGIVIVDNPDSSTPIHPEEIQMLQLFANQAGMALENSQLYKNLEETHAELHDTRQRLVHAAHLAAIGEMAASISHELKTPLITIGGFASRLGRTIGEDSQQRHYLDTIISEAQRLEKLLGDILTYSRKPTICYHQCNLKAVIQQCLDDFAPSFNEHCIKLHKELPDGHWIILGDESQLKQVCINLLVNAVDAMRNGGKIKVTLERGASGQNDSAILKIHDSGGGIPSDVLARIFTPFFTTKRHGTGLGLAIVSRIIQNHGGTLVASNKDDGALFTITLPLSKPCEDL